MRSIFSTSFQYLAVLAPDGTLLDANATLLRGIGATLESVVGQPFWAIPWFTGTPGAAERVRDGVRVAASGRQVRDELRVNLPAGSRQFDFALRPVPGPDGTVVAIVPEAIDVTERRHAEERLHQSQKMEAVGQLTGGVAHDFNNLLQIISANLHLLAKLTAGNERATVRIGSARAAVDRGARLASQLLAFGRRQALTPKVVNIGRFVAGMEDMLKRSLGEAIEMQVVVSPSLWNTFVDPTQVENALLNLALNARDAMDGQGQLTVEVGNAALDDAYARRHADVVPGQYVMLAVSDTGNGMTPDVAAQAFQPFFTTKPVGSGTGLGLSMVYGFVRQSGGHVKIYSEPGEGTTVRVYLPRSRQAAASDRSELVAPLDGGAETVLVVEDDDGVRASTIEMLTELGYQVLMAHDAASALKVIESGASIDLLFTDVVMPGTLTSVELVRRAQQRSPGLAVLFTSGYTRNAIVHGGRLDDGVELLAKPYTLEALAQRLRAVLAKHAAPRLLGAWPEPAPLATRPPPALAVLLVEDDDAVRSSAAEMVRTLGHSVFEADSAEAAMDVLSRTPIDVLVTDLGLPGESGEVLAAEARSVKPQLRVVFATGTDRIGEIGDGGFSPVLLKKPYDSAGLAAAIRGAGSH